MMNGFVPVTVGIERFNAAQIVNVDTFRKHYIEIWLLNEKFPLVLENQDAEAFLAWWDLRADILHASEDSDE